VSLVLIILGCSGAKSFIVRNAYLLIDFGSFVDEAPPGTNAPFIQLLPITNASQASIDFAEARSANGTDTTIDLSTTKTQKSSTTSSTKSSTSNLPIWEICVIVASVILLVLLLSCLLYYLPRWRSKLASASTKPSWTPYRPQPYQPLYDPSPQGAYDMYMAPSTKPVHTPPVYTNAWDAHY